ncbi:DUF2806 domain-containing protein [Patescibacteria group bacterium]|nr:DUF2806 domain-containing protein [Patescibacteria group bacterium]
MNFINKFFETFNLSFSWKNNRKKTNKQKGGGLQVQQEKNSITNIINIENVNVATIEELTGDNLPNSTNNLLKNAGQRFLAEQKARQYNFTEIVDKANLKAINAPQELDKDWFLRWMEISQTVSRENVQDILAKILSEQVTTKDTFSLRTLDVLKSLSR